MANLNEIPEDELYSHLQAIQECINGYKNIDKLIDLLYDDTKSKGLISENNQNGYMAASHNIELSMAKLIDFETQLIEAIQLKGSINENLRDIKSKH